MYIEAFNNYGWVWGGYCCGVVLNRLFLSACTCGNLKDRWSTNMATLAKADRHRSMRRVSGGGWISGVTIALTLLTLICLPMITSMLTSFRTMDDISMNGFWSLPQMTRANLKNCLINSPKHGRSRTSAVSAQRFIITIPSLACMLFLSSLSAYSVV
jgi:hypothetical protein